MVKSIRKKHKIAWIGKDPGPREKYEKKWNDWYFEKRERFLLYFVLLCTCFSIFDLISTYFGLSAPGTYETNLILSTALSYIGDWGYLASLFYNFCFIYISFKILTLFVDSSKALLNRYLQLEIFVGLYSVLTVLFLNEFIRNVLNNLSYVVK